MRIRPDRGVLARSFRRRVDLAGLPPPSHFLPAAALLAAVAVAACDARDPVQPEPGPGSRPGCAPAGAQPVRLESGQSVDPAAAQLACLWLPGGAAARYVLAWADARPSRAAQAAPEPASFAEFTITAGEAGVPAAAAQRGRADAAAASDVVFATGEPLSFQQAFTLRPTPWSLDERVTFGSAERGIRNGRVIRIWGGHFVLLLIEEDSASLRQAWLDAVDAAFESVLDGGLALLQEVWGPGLPITSTGSGQLVIIAQNLTGFGGVASAHQGPEYDAMLSTVSLNLSGTTNPEAMLHLVVHELVHTYQYRYMAGTAPAGAQDLRFAPRWAMEGTANLIATEHVRRRAGIGLLANWDWRCCPAGSPNGQYAQPARAQAGRFLDGYDQSATFLADLVQRRVLEGQDTTAAFRDVALGAVEGWYGFDMGGLRRTGLVARQQQASGGAWDPAAALLTWTISQALDDRTDSAVYQNRAYLSVSDGPGRLGWKPHATIGPGQAQAVRVQGGSTGWIELEPGPGGAAFTVVASSPHIAWRLARVR
jgi:hypothetical protein